MPGSSVGTEPSGVTGGSSVVRVGVAVCIGGVCFSGVGSGNDGGLASRRAALVAVPLSEGSSRSRLTGNSEFSLSRNVGRVRGGFSVDRGD